MVVNFFGRRGCGKTTAIRGTIKYCRSPVVIIDLLGNYNSEEYYQTDSIPDALEVLKDNFDNEEQIIICLKTNDPTAACEYMASALWHCEGGTLILDEVDSIRITENSCFDSFIRYGRNHDCDFITGCRRPAELDKNITAAADKFYCFNTHEIRDIEYFEGAVLGERAEQLLTLPKYSGLFIDYHNEIQGTFRIDIDGNIFHTSQEPIK